MLLLDAIIVCLCNPLHTVITYMYMYNHVFHIHVHVYMPYTYTPVHVCEERAVNVVMTNIINFHIHTAAITWEARVQPTYLHLQYLPRTQNIACSSPA